MNEAESFGGRYKLLKKLGEGAQSIVHEVIDTKDSNKRWIWINYNWQFFVFFCLYFQPHQSLFSKALKQYNAFSSNEDLKWIEEEIELLKSLSNKHIIKYLDSFVEKFKNLRIFYIVFDLCQVNIRWIFPIFYLLNPIQNIV